MPKAVLPRKLFRSAGQQFDIIEIIIRGDILKSLDLFSLYRTAVV